jgi:hypothetical protein
MSRNEFDPALRWCGDAPGRDMKRADYGDQVNRYPVFGWMLFGVMVLMAIAESPDERSIHAMASVPDVNSAGPVNAP